VAFLENPRACDADGVGHPRPAVRCQRSRRVADGAARTPARTKRAASGTSASREALHGLPNVIAWVAAKRGPSVPACDDRPGCPERADPTTPRAAHIARVMRSAAR
jgi:hypothetical protein